RNISKLMDSGVTFINLSSSFVHYSVKIGKDTFVYPNTYIEGNTSLGRN
ncbi:MAG TPA: bifunctional UDP-N-acetylglucosamine diphosphorylase/glucosamine-1-phosphate N-acetyltransferase GlmU, partial [Nitrospirae bacterium]|nr:bifunctional UDP-N-acetylglucosamine diphosphorylase/glucosamine-1-phosphate N-acetyltransferase GlmU [Nitrospirota bacterium]